MTFSRYNGNTSAAIISHLKLVRGGDSDSSFGSRSGVETTISTRKNENLNLAVLLFPLKAYIKDSIPFITGCTRRKQNSNAFLGGDSQWHAAPAFTRCAFRARGFRLRNDHSAAAVSQTGCG